MKASSHASLIGNPTVMDLPLVVYSKQKRPALKAEGINALVDGAESDKERYLYLLLATTGMRISEALALEARHFINGGLTILVEQQVEKDRPRIVNYLKTSGHGCGSRESPDFNRKPASH